MEINPLFYTSFIFYENLLFSLIDYKKDELIDLTKLIN